MSSQRLGAQHMASQRLGWDLLWRIPWILINAALSALLGAVVIWGPFDGALPVVRAGALLCGAGALVLWTWQARTALRGDRIRARRLFRRLLGVPLTVVAAGALVALVQLTLLGSLVPRGGNRLAEFDHLWRTMDRHYAYFDLKGVDWDAVRARYRPLIAADGATDGDYFPTLYRMLAELHDGHTELQQPDVIHDGLTMFGLTREMAGEAVVVVVGATGRGVGLTEGAVLLEVGGEPVAAALARWSDTVARGSTPWYRRWVAHRFLLATYDDSLEVTFEDLDGARRTVVLAPDPGAVAQNAAPEPVPPVTAERLPSGVGLIRITDFAMHRGPALIRSFDAALDSVFDAPGIILDMRGHDGGFSVWGDLIAGRFFEESFDYGISRYRSRLPQHVWRSRSEFRVTARGRTYTGPVAVLIDAATFSSGEAFAVAMADSGRAIMVGRQTAGATGNPIQIRLRGGRVRFSTGDFVRMDGSQLEGVGVAPDVAIDWTRDDFLAGTDPDVAAAEAALLEE